MSLERTPESEKKHILGILNWFHIPPLDFMQADKELTARVEKNKSFTTPEFLDTYLIRHISRLYDNKKEGILWHNTEERQFRGLISLCFNGEVSFKCWDMIWRYLTDDEKIFYTTTYYHLGVPVEIAANNGNLEALKRLNTIYKDLLPRHTDRYYSLHLQLRQALLALPKMLYDADQNKLQAFDMLLEMCKQNATVIDMSGDANLISNREFHCHAKDYAIVNMKQSLPDVFLGICQDMIRGRRYYDFDEYAWAIGKIASFVEKNSSVEEFANFEQKLADLLQTNKPFYHAYLKLHKKEHLIQGEQEVTEKSKWVDENSWLFSVASKNQEVVKPDIDDEVQVVYQPIDESSSEESDSHEDLRITGNIPKQVGLLKQKHLKSLSEEIERQLGIYQDQINEGSVFSSRVDLWEKKKAVLIVAKRLLDNGGDPLVLKDIEDKNAGWDDGFVAKDLVNKAKNLLGIPLAWNDYPVDKSESGKKEFERRRGLLLDEVRIQGDDYKEQQKNGPFATDTRCALWQKKINVMTVAYGVLLGKKTATHLRLEEKENPGWDDGVIAKGLVERVKQRMGIPLDWRDYDPDAVEEEDLTDKIAGRIEYYEKQLPSLQPEHSWFWNKDDNQQKRVALDSKIKVLKIAQSILLQGKNINRLSDDALKGNDYVDWDKGEVTKALISRIRYLKEPIVQKRQKLEI